MLQVHRASTGALVGRLAGSLTDTDGSDAFAAEPVVIQSAGMRRWLSHGLSEQLGQTGQRDGISANVRFVYPGTIVREVVRAATGDDPDPDRWSPDRLVWSILELLPQVLDEGDARPLRAYLGTVDEVDRRTYALCRRIADLFDRYAIYRPGMVADWRQDRRVDADSQPLPDAQLWQPLLWNRLTGRLGDPSPDQRFADTITTLRDTGVGVDGLPQRIAFFGTNVLPPSYLELIAALANRSDVTLYVSPPSDRSWEELRRSARDEPAPDPDALRERGGEQANPLLAACGRLARDFQLTLESLDGGHEEIVSADGDDDGSARTVLSLLQADIRADRERGAPTADGDDPRRPDPVELPDDRTVQVHACHGPSRQVEVLRDVLLDLFDDSDLEPRDVLVMTPDIATYAPLVSATFGHGPTTRAADGRPPAIPFQLADRTLRRTNPIAEALLEILYLADSRFEVSRVLDLLALNPVRRRFGIEETEMRTIRSWVAETGIRWGIDPDHRTDHGQPPDRFHTWRFGLDRLLVGATMADEDDRVFADVTPYDDMEGDDVELLSRFVTFCRTLFDTVETLRDPRPADGWAQAVHEVLDALTTVDEDDAWLDQQVRDNIADLVDASRVDDDNVPVAVPLTLTGMRTVLEGALDDIAGAAGYETGKVTVCSMIPMRSIPHRVICLLGMDDGAFPRTGRPAGFDLIAAAPRVGDRTPRDEDRYLFLEAILSARDHLVITYTGRDQRTNEPKAPAVPVGELLDVLDRGLVEDADGRSARERLITEHPLQAFSPRNFGIDERGRPRDPLSHDLDQLVAARTMLEDRRRRPDFFPGDLPLPEGTELDVVEVADLIAFYDNPTKWLLNRRLGLRLREYRTQIEDVEPVEAGPLESWGIGDSLLEARLDGRDHDGWERAYLSRGEVPVGAPGAYEINKVAEPVDEIARLVEQDRVPDPQSLPVDVEVAGRRLMGAVPGLHGDVILRSQYTRIKPKHRLQQWVRLLALTAAYPHRGIRARLVSKAERGDDVEDHRLGPPSDDPAEAADLAAGHLAVLIDHYHQGHRRPLPLFPQASAAYARAIRAGRSQDQAMKKAKDAFEPNYQGWGTDIYEEHIAHLYAGLEFEDVIDGTDFVDVSLAVWLPPLEAEAAQ